MERATNADPPQEASALLAEMAASARGRGIIAFTLCRSDDPAMFLDLPLGEPGPVYGWTGIWHTAEGQATGSPPHTVVATGPAGGVVELRRQVEQIHRLPYIGELVRDDASVVIASASPTALSAPLVRVSDPGPLIERWLELATSQ